MTKEQTIHTPGPWEFASTGKNMQGYSQPFGILQSGAANLIAGIFGDVKDGLPTCEANARLIAAAPELLEALQIAEVTILRLETRHGSFSSAQGTLDVIRAATAKATAP